jgi:hypothetical protein
MRPKKDWSWRSFLISFVSFLYQERKENENRFWILLQKYQELIFCELHSTFFACHAKKVSKEKSPLLKFSSKI